MEDIKHELHPGAADLVVDNLAYMSLKSGFKQSLCQNIQTLNKLITSADHSHYQSLIFAVLNLVRSSDFDKLPSSSLAEHDKSKQMDISYFELKELQKTIGRRTAEQQGLLNQNFENEYGDDCSQIRVHIATNTSWLDYLGSTMRQWLIKEAGVTTIKMVSETLLLLAHETSLGPILVQKVRSRQLINCRECSESWSISSLQWWTSRVKLCSSPEKP